MSEDEVATKKHIASGGVDGYFKGDLYKKPSSTKLKSATKRMSSKKSASRR